MAIGITALPAELLQQIFSYSYILSEIDKASASRTCKTLYYPAMKALLGHMLISIHDNNVHIASEGLKAAFSRQPSLAYGIQEVALGTRECDSTPTEPQRYHVYNFFNILDQAGVSPLTLQLHQCHTKEGAIVWCDAPSDSTEPLRNFGRRLEVVAAQGLHMRFLIHLLSHAPNLQEIMLHTVLLAESPQRPMWPHLPKLTNVTLDRPTMPLLEGFIQSASATLVVLNLRGLIDIPPEVRIPPLPQLRVLKTWWGDGALCALLTACEGQLESLDLTMGTQTPQDVSKAVELIRKSAHTLVQFRLRSLAEDQAIISIFLELIKQMSSLEMLLCTSNFKAIDIFDSMPQSVQCLSVVTPDYSYVPSFLEVARAHTAERNKLLGMGIFLELWDDEAGVDVIWNDSLQEMIEELDVKGLSLAELVIWGQGQLRRKIVYPCYMHGDDEDCDIECEEEELESDEGADSDNTEE